MTTPYTYLIGWTSLKTFYYGVRWKANCQPEDLWVLYFTSSKEVKAFREENGDPDIIQVRKVFSNPQDARRFETRVLRRMKVAGRSDFLNITESPTPSFRRKHTEESKAKMSAARSGKPRSPETRLKISMANKGKKKKAESIEKMKSSLRGKKHTQQSRRNMSLSKLGSKASDEARRAISVGNSGGKHWNAKQCKVGDLVFSCMKEAAKHFGISRHDVAKLPSFQQL